MDGRSREIEEGRLGKDNCARTRNLYPASLHQKREDKP